MPLDVMLPMFKSGVRALGDPEINTHSRSARLMRPATLLTSLNVNYNDSPLSPYQVCLPQIALFPDHVLLWIRNLLYVIKLSNNVVKLNKFTYNNNVLYHSSKLTLACWTLSSVFTACPIDFLLYWTDLSSG